MICLVGPFLRSSEAFWSSERNYVERTELRVASSLASHRSASKRDGYPYAAAADQRGHDSLVDHEAGLTRTGRERTFLQLPRRTDL